MVMDENWVFGGQHVVYTEVKIWCMHEIHSYKPMLPQKIK